MNLPNKLTISRVILAPLAMLFILYPLGGETCARITAAALFAITSLTDMLDGKIARKYNLITNFGKFMDPLADKFMVIGMLVSMCASDMYVRFRPLLIWATLLVVLRELAVTSLRLLAVSSEKKIVIAANKLGKIKTVTQIVCISALILEPLMFPFDKLFLLSWTTIAAMTVITLWSGINYLMAYKDFIDPNN